MKKFLFIALAACVIVILALAWKLIALGFQLAGEKRSFNAIEHHFSQISQKNPPMQSIRIIEIPDCKMVSSGVGMFGEEKFDGFAKWFSSLPPTMHPQDYLSATFDEKGEFNGMIWYYVYDGVNAPEGYDIVDFKGGLYAVTTDIDQRTDIAAMDTEIHAFLAANNLEQDPSRPRLGHIISSPSAQKALGYSQMDYFMPVKPR